MSDFNENIDFEAFLEHIPTLNEEELRAVRSRAEASLAKQKRPVLTKKETELLKQINKGIPDELYNPYCDLLKKSTQNTITKEERKELIQLIPAIENATADWLQHIVDLAKLWKMTAREVMLKLEITPPELSYS